MSGRAFTVPQDDVRWCAALAEALSVCCASPSNWRVREVTALLAAPPEQMLTASWAALVETAARWLALLDSWPAGRMLPAFAGLRLIEAALRDMPVPVPAWADRYA